MTFWLVIAGAVIGLILAHEASLFGLVVGSLVGALWARITILERRLGRWEGGDVPSAGVRAEHAEEPTHVHGWKVPGSASGKQPTPPQPVVDEPASTASAPVASAPVLARRDAAPVERSEGKPGEWSGGTPGARIWQWFTEGNVPVKVGMLVLFVGVAALLQYATEAGWLSAPIELRLLGVALVGVVGLGLGWRLRKKRPGFALSLQGGAIGVLALTIFAGFRLYDVVPAPLAFALLLGLTGLAGSLAVVQNALALAVMALIAGFAAPVLVSTGEGNHVALFSWYALLNLGVFGVAWYRSWPLLNRLGFAFTFIIGTVWGVLGYTPDRYTTTQPFLILFFVLFLLIPIFNELRARRTGPGRLDPVLVFGLPLFAFPLQASLLEGERLAIAASALVLALVYFATAVALLRRWHIRPLGRSHAVLAIGFATLAVPFAFSAPTVTVIWALEGAALVWFGLYQHHRLSRLTGLALQAAAVVPWLVVLEGSSRIGEMPVFNSLYLGGVALTVSLGISAWRYADHGASRWLVNALALVSLLAWVVAGVLEFPPRVASMLEPDVLLFVAVVSALLSAIAHRYRHWAVTGVAPAVLLATGNLLVFGQQYFHEWPLGGWGLAAWAGFVLSAWGVQWYLAGSRPLWRGLAALATHSALLLMLGVTLVHVAARILEMGPGWQWLAGGLPLLVAGAWVGASRPAPFSPRSLPARQQGWVRDGLAAALVVGLLCSLQSPGGAAPLPFVPALNPLEIGQILALWLVVRLCATRGLAGRELLPWIAGLGFVVISAMVLRGVHHFADVAWMVGALSDSRVAQAALSVCWTGLGVIAWVAGSRRGSREIWWAGAILLGVVLIKLVLIDRVFLSTVAGIVSFLAFGLLSILVGYLAPAPPRATNSRPESGY